MTQQLDHDGQLEKVVLAGAVDITSKVPIDRSQVASRLAARFPGCWTYSHDGLVGATPELLVDCRDGPTSCSTTPRNATNTSWRWPRSPGDWPRPG